MNRYLYSIAFALSVSLLPFLGNAQSNQASATLNVVLSNTQSLNINEGQKTINLNFTTLHDYKNGVSVVESKHLNVFSTSKFAVKVIATGNLKSSDGTEIPVNTISVNPSGASNAISGLTTNEAVLSTTVNQPIINSPEKGTLGTSFDIEYNAGSGSSYMSRNQGDYSTTIIYTIEAQ